MFSDIKKLIKQSTVYGIGDILRRLAGFLLLPIYMNYFTPAEYGALELFYMTSSLFSIFLGRQLSHATLRYYFEYEKQHDRNLVVSSSFILYIGIVGTILIIASFFSSEFSILIFSNGQFTREFMILFAWMFFDLSKEILYAYIRAIERVKFFLGVSIVELVVKLLLCIYFVVSLELGLTGVLLGNLVGAIIAWLFLASYTLGKCGLGIDLTKFKEMFKYVLPLIFVGLSATVITNADRYFLKTYFSLSDVGLYGLAIRFAMILNFFMIQPFSKGYGPFRFSIMNKENAKEIYVRVTTYFYFFCVWTGIAIVAFSREIIQIMAKESYWTAYPLIPILLIAVLGQGLYYMFQIGVYINKNTKVLSWGYAAAVVINLILLAVLVPLFGPYGAASSLSITYMFIAFMGLYFSNRVYYLPYEWMRLAKISFVFSVLLPVLFISYDSNPYMSVLLKLPIILSFPLIMYLLRFFNHEELSKIRQCQIRLKGVFTPS